MRGVTVYNEKDFPVYLPKLNALYSDLFSSGKGFRSRLIALVSEPLNLEPEVVRLLAQTIEFIHNASLLHDDLIDRSPLRRNKTAAWLKYTPEYAVLAGDYLLARVMINLSRYGNLRLIQYTAEIIGHLLEGEWIQDSLVHDWNVHLGQLDQVHNLKTASLFKWCVRAPFMVTRTDHRWSQKKDQNEEDLHALLEKIGELLGLLFQRSDDLLDFDVRNFEKKETLGDLKSGYLNSFGAYLSHDLSSKQKEAFRNAIDMDKVMRVIGEKDFQRKLEKFDRMNEQVIDLYFHYLESLREFLMDEEKILIERLAELPGPLYWRKI